MNQRLSIQELLRQMIEVTLIWTGISALILLKSALWGPLAQMQLISFSDEFLAWLVSLLIIPALILMVNKGADNRACLLTFGGILLVAGVSSMAWSHFFSREIILPLTIESAGEQLSSDNIWVNKEARFFPSETIDMFSSIVIISCISMLVRFVHVSRKRELNEMKLAGLLAESNLHLLKSQMHPHFIFNTLNTVSGLMEKDIDAAQKILEDLSFLLRSSLRQSKKQNIRLGEELEFVTHYLDIERVRFRHPIELELDICENCAEAAIPHMILQPLLENAVKHGFQGLDKAAHVLISAKREAADLILLIQDNGHGLRFPISYGIGLELVQQRLASLYDGQASFDLESPAEGGTTVVIRFPFYPISTFPTLE
ncbi:MAG: histidine kinase [Bacteroidota bacterium]